MKFYSQYPLDPHHSFRLKAQAERAIEVQDIKALTEVTRFLQRESLPFWVLGQGTNTLFLEDLKGLVILPQFAGVQVLEQTKETVTVKAAAGEDWDDFVAWGIEQGFYGLEPLSLIPGSVGAAPIQNIGAYGTELDQWVDSVICWDWAQAKQVVLSAQACGFGYRSSSFKTQWRARYLILDVVFKLHKRNECCVRYGDLKTKLGSDVSDPRAVRQAVIELRRSKLPDPKVLPNAGSFFKNPIVSQKKFEQLKNVHGDIKGFKVETGRTGVTGVKIAAGWLLESLGFKGFQQNGVGCYEQHALVLVNTCKPGQSLNGKQVVEFIKLVKEKVRSAYQIELEVEPNLVIDAWLLRV